MRRIADWISEHWAMLLDMWHLANLPREEWEMADGEVPGDDEATGVGA